MDDQAAGDRRTRQQSDDDRWRHLEGADYTVKSVGTREKRRNPVAPFITSTLQQESSRKLRFSVKRTMMLAQRLYEGVEIGQGRRGRSDHLHAYGFHARFRRRHHATCAITSASKLRAASILPEAPNIYKSKKDAQDAHEAIRPTSHGVLAGRWWRSIWRKTSSSFTG